jgi:AraC-like DNA-binding protein
LFALYQKELHCSPHQLWLLIQIEQACNQILQERVMVGDLVDMLGFSTRRCFERAFRRHTGMNVSQYRESGLGSFW